MLTLEQLIALHGLFTGRGQGSRSTVPTDASISRINSNLGIILPHAFIEFAQRCPAYSYVLFASIGDDCEILEINTYFHKNRPACVPPWLIMFNRGHDEDCQGFDSRERDANGEYPIVYWDASQGLEFDNSEWRVFQTFRDYLQFSIIYYAERANKDRAERIIHSV